MIMSFGSGEISAEIASDRVRKPGWLLGPGVSSICLRTISSYHFLKILQSTE